MRSSNDSAFLRFTNTQYMRIGLGTQTRMMVERIVGTGLRAQLLAAIRALLSKFA